MYCQNSVCGQIHETTTVTLATHACRGLTMEDDEKLIEAVHVFPCLCELSNKAYKVAKMKKNAWTKVGNQVNAAVITAFDLL